MLAYLLLQLAATEKAVPPLPQFRCWNGAAVADAGECPKYSPSPSLSPPATVSAVPRGNPGSWVTTNDYPSSALRIEAEGTTGFRLQISADGRALNCQIISSSGDAALDAATCTNVTRRARFQPALDAEGNPTEGFYSNRVRWQIPLDPSYVYQTNILDKTPQLAGAGQIDIDRDYPVTARALRQGGEVTVSVDVSDMGRVRACAVTKSSGFAALDIQSCRIAKRWTNYYPAYDETGKPIGGRAVHNFVWIAPKVYDANGQLLPLAAPSPK